MYLHILTIWLKCFLNLLWDFFISVIFLPQVHSVIMCKWSQALTDMPNLLCAFICKKYMYSTFIYMCACLVQHAGHAASACLFWAGVTSFPRQGFRRISTKFPLSNPGMAQLKSIAIMDISTREESPSETAFSLLIFWALLNLLVCVIKVAL